MDGYRRTPPIVVDSGAAPSRRGSQAASARLLNFRRLAGYRGYAPAHGEESRAPGTTRRCPLGAPEIAPSALGRRPLTSKDTPD